MTDKERLEEIKEIINQAQSDYDAIDFIGMNERLDTLFLESHIDWLFNHAKEQAERVQELERSNKQIKRNIGIYQSINEDAVEKNKRYRESIKKAISYFNYDEHQRGMAELQKALGEY